MKVIGTGLSGLVGSRVVEMLQREHDFVDFSLDSGVDITNFEELETAFIKNKEAEVVLHLAAFTDVDKANEQNGDKQDLCYQVNVLGTKNISLLCHSLNKFLIHISTDFVFDGTKDGVYTEADAPHPIEWYGLTKFWAEEEIEQSRCKAAILRIAFPFKAKPSPPKLEPKVKLDLVRKIRNKLEKGEPVFAFSDQIITPTFIDDIAKIIEKMLKAQSRGIFHAVGSTSLSPLALAIKVAENFSLRKNLVKEILLTDYLAEHKRPRQKRLALSNKKLRRELGIKMSTIDQALKQVKQQLTT